MLELSDDYELYNLSGLDTKIELFEEMMSLVDELNELEDLTLTGSEANGEIEKQNDNEPVIVVGKENWHHGVIGIVSSKVTDLYFKPSILIPFSVNQFI